MARIIVGKEYEKAFLSACNLVGSGRLGKDLRLQKSGSRTEISDGTYCYTLGDGFGDGENDEIFMGESGASWFSALRGESVGNQNAVWVAFLESLASRYHKLYSLVEYRQKPADKAEEERNGKLLSAYAANLCEALFPAVAGSITVRKCPERESAEDIYGVSLRLELTNGTGAAVPVLCKVYFCKKGGTLIPLSADEGRRVGEYLRSVRADPSGGEGRAEGALIDETLNALDRLITGGDFSAAMCCEANEDENTLLRLIGGTAGDSVVLECQRVKVLGVLHVKWNVAAADLCLGEKRVLRLVVDEGGRATLSCLNCREGYGLVENNVIRVTDDAGVERAVTADPAKKFLGLAEEKLEAIRTSKEFAPHLMKLACAENPRSGSCSRVVCASEAFTFEAGGRKIVKCKDCPYPEIVYTGPDGVPRYTPSLAFARDRGDLVERTELRYCTLCGRSFTRSALSGGLCPLCSRAETGSEEARKTYRKYADILSPVRRLSPGKKYCYEDDEILLFVVGKKTYIFDKLDVASGGYIAAPKKL